MYEFLLPLERAERGSTTERVYAALRDAIVFRLLKPGEFIDKNAVCDRLGVSRFPVSEALGRLDQQGFAEILPQRGTRVSRIRLDDVRQNLFIRRALEAETVGELARRGDRALLDRMERSIESQRAALLEAESGAFYVLDLEFHAILQDALGYPRVTSAIDAARAGLDRVRRMLGSMHRLAITFDEHARIVEAIGSGSPVLAADAMRAHIDSVMTHLSAFSAEHPDMFSAGES